MNCHAVTNKMKCSYLGNVAAGPLQVCKFSTSLKMLSKNLNGSKCVNSLAHEIVNNTRKTDVMVDSVSVKDVAKLVSYS